LHLRSESVQREETIMIPSASVMAAPRSAALARHTRRTHERGSRFVLRPLAAALAACAFFSPTLSVSGPLPVGPTVANGKAVIATSGTRMTVISSPNAILNWQSFSIGSDYGVNFRQQSATSQVLNRVTGNDPSQILGSLTSNGRVWLINPHGVLFGQNARIDVAGLVASTLDISNADFLANRESG
jgi:filamentous hemagglutinin family protein